jgi:molybdopterin-guanine dinucleotide biosynthesis protein A
LLPVNGHPVADYVIQALEQSDVEKIFIIQEEGANLKESLTSGAKCIFFNKDRDHSSLGMGSFFAIQKVAEYYGDSELKNKTIMIVPCDTPLVTKDSFNSLIKKMVGNNADVTITIIGAEHLEKRYPPKRFRGVYLSDFKADYTMQNVLFVNGEFIQLKPPGEPGKLKFSFRG